MDISAEIAAIQAASQGSELRQPLVGALNKLNSGSLPAVTASDAGKILKVGANGWEVGEKSGYMPVPTGTMQITDNGTYDVTDFASAQVHVSGGGSAVLVPKTITQNGTYDPTDDNADGYSEVVVNVSSQGTQSVNIKIGNTNPIIKANGVVGIMSNYASDFIVPVFEDNSFAKVDLSQPFEICCRFKVANNPGSSGKNVWGSSNSYYHCPTIAIFDNKIVVYITSNGSSWNISNGEAITPSGYTLPLNTWITAIMTWDGTDFSISVDDGSDTYVMTKTNATPYYNSNYSFEFGGQYKSAYSIAASNASIDLSHTYLKQNGLIVWGLESAS